MQCDDPSIFRMVFTETNLQGRLWRAAALGDALGCYICNYKVDIRLRGGTSQLTQIVYKVAHLCKSNTIFLIFCGGTANIFWLNSNMMELS